MTVSNELKDFAFFVRTQKLNEFVDTDLEMLHSFNLPLLRKLSHLGDDVLKEMIKASLTEFLIGLEQGNAIDIISNRLETWRSNSIQGIGKIDITLEDILQGYVAQKMSLWSFLPVYFPDVNHNLRVISALEQCYSELQRMAIGTLYHIQHEETGKRLEAEERYKDLFDNASDLIHFITPEGNIMHVNRSWCDTLGYSEEESAGTSIYDYLIEEDREKFKRHREKVIAGQEQGTVTVRFKKRNGSQVTLEYSLTCKVTNGQPQYTRGILRDMTTTILYEQSLTSYNEELAEQNDNMSRLIKNAPDAIIVINEDSLIELWNPKAELVFGWQASEVVGKVLTDFIIPQIYREAHTVGMRRYLTTGDAQVLNRTIEITALNKAGVEFYIALTISKSGRKNKGQFIAFLRDIDLQKRNERKLMEQRLALEKNNEELSQYNYLASHDLKEPLRKILIFSDILFKKHKDELSPAAETFLRKIDKSVRQMSELVDGVLSYSSNSDRFDFTTVDLGDLVKNIIEEFDHVIQEKSASITVSEMPHVPGSPDQLKSVFSNLIINALKYSKTNTAVIIDVTATEDDSYFIINIKDNGIGFNMKHIDYIFQMFRRLHSNNVYEGTGIGLALCKKIVENHGGVVLATSVEAVGSVFTVKLPKHKAG